MLKIQKLSLAALMVSAVVSGSVFAEDKAAPSAIKVVLNMKRL